MAKKTEIILSGSGSAIFFVGSVVYYTCAAIIYFTSPEQDRKLSSEIAAVSIGSVFALGSIACGFLSCYAARDGYEDDYSKLSGESNV